jgi:hypothetical protein
MRTKIPLIIRQCSQCGVDFQQRAGGQRKTCKALRCIKLEKWASEEPATLDHIPRKASPYRTDLDYHGRPYL